MQINDKSGRKHYLANEDRYNNMQYRRCGQSGIQLPAISLGLWHNFGSIDSIHTARDILRAAFDLGIVHFDLANNYGPAYGTAEETFRTIYQKDFKTYRNELFLSTKAGFEMWPGPYGNFGSRKYLISSLDDSLKRMGVDYVDLFYHHRPDPDTPLEETMRALDQVVRQGKALYVGISNYPADLSKKAAELLKSMGTPCLIHQARYSMLDRWVEKDLLDTLQEKQIGCIAFSPLAQGMLTDKYLAAIPASSRAGKQMTFLTESMVKGKLPIIKALNEIAMERGQKLAQMAIAWLLRDKRISSVLIGASSVKQLEDNIKSLDKISFSEEELSTINSILSHE
jgi:L-glyceraldehyde 3-phosphate reductase